MAKFERHIEIRWADIDQNGHVRHSAYNDYGAHLRIQFFAEQGLSQKKMADLRLGPILFKEECSFIKEIHPDQALRMTLLKGPISEDGSKWVLHHELFNDKDEKVAHLSVQGAWMHMDKRKLMIPPFEYVKAMHDLPQGDYYVYKKNKS